MSYSDFTLSRLVTQFGLKLDEKQDLYADIAPVPIRPEFQQQIRESLGLALLVSTEKARSEFLIAPVLLEFWRLTGGRFGLLSGVEFSVDPEADLTGVCDYIITLSPEFLYITSPVVLIVEAKNEELKRGYAQCIAEIVAAQRFNELGGSPREKTYGIVTVGDKWRFLEIQGAVVQIDRTEYHIEGGIPKIIGVLLHMVGIDPGSLA